MDNSNDKQREALLREAQEFLRVIDGRYAVDLTERIDDALAQRPEPPTVASPCPLCGGPVERVGYAEWKSQTTAWLIERGQKENHAPTVWLFLYDTGLREQWTTDANKALRFATRQQAEAYVEQWHGGMNWPHSITEHSWFTNEDVEKARASPVEPPKQEPVAWQVLVKSPRGTMSKIGYRDECDGWLKSLGAMSDDVTVDWRSLVYASPVRDQPASELQKFCREAIFPEPKPPAVTMDEDGECKP